MFRKDYLRLVFSFCLVLTAGIAAFAQSAAVSGRVEVKKSDSTLSPLAGALVEVYRTDIKATMPSTKTNKRGEFTFAGLPLGARFVFSVSGPGATPSYFPNVKAGDDKIVFTLQEGDGKRWTEEEIRTALSSRTAADGTVAQATEDQKKAQAEYEKKVAETNAKNEDIKNKNAIIDRSLKEGNDAFNAKNYDLAIAKYTEGINADPNFVGSAPILLNNKGVALKIIAVDKYNKAVKSSDPNEKATTLAAAKKDLEDALAALTSSWTVIKSAPQADIANQATFDKAKYDALVGLADTYRLLVLTKTNVAKATDAKAAFDAYLAVETDPVKKTKAQVTLGDVMLEAGESEPALAAYKVALEGSPDNPDALAGVGFSLVNLGYLNNDKAQLQEGANFLQKFASVAPETHKFKADAVALIDTLKKEQNVTPQKVSGGKKRN